MQQTREQSEKLNVSRTALYNKLNRSEPLITQALVRYTTEQFQPMIAALGGQAQELLPGYRVRILDGNCLGASEHRRFCAAGLAFCSQALENLWWCLTR